MKRLYILLAAVLLLSLGMNAFAEGGVSVEIMKVDGISVVVFIPEETALQARGAAMNAKGAEDSKADYVLPSNLTRIEEEAFMCIPAQKIELSANIEFIDARAFADCASLREVVIPAAVKSISDHAFDGCEDVTIYGEKGTEAERIANLYGFTFVSPQAQDEPIDPAFPEGKANIPVLPLVTFK